MKVSLKIKAVLLLLIFTVVLSLSTVCISCHTYTKSFNRHYGGHALTITRSTATAVNTDEVKKLAEMITGVYDEICRENGGQPNFDSFSDSDWNEYYLRFAHIAEQPEYIDLMEVLQELRDDTDVLSLYIGYSDPKSGKNFYLVDASNKEQTCIPGDFNDDNEKHIEYMRSSENNKQSILVNNKEHGWLCSAMSPILDNYGTEVGIVLVDVSMSEVIEARRDFLIKVTIIIAVLALIMILIMLFLVDKKMLDPINRLSDAANMYVTGKKHNLALNESEVLKLNIKTGDEIETLSDSIKQMTSDINSYIKQLTEATAEKERIGSELEIARNIQSSMLPCIFPPFPDRKEFDIYATMAPAKEVGGDFYDLFLIDDNHLAVVIADVSGKGIPAALFMVITKTLIKNQAQTKLMPSEVFNIVNNQLCENNDEDFFVTAWMGVLEIDSGKFTFVNAGHNPPLLKRANGEFEFLKAAPGFVLAGMEEIKYKQQEITLSSGDYLYMYTDGVTEAENSAIELYGEKRLVNTLNRFADCSAQELLPKVRADIDAFVKDVPQFDDITMLAMKYLGNINSGITVSADKKELQKVFDFIGKTLDELNCPAKMRNQIYMAAEEIFINIASYAYTDKCGDVSISATKSESPQSVTIEFSDSGTPYNPLENTEPDITLPADKRKIGGLGILLAQKCMDDIKYEHKNNKNILTMRKNI